MPSSTPEARTDRNNNPTALTVDIAKQAGLTEGSDYVVGDPFEISGRTLYTAKLIGDPIGITIRVINKISFYTGQGRPRWDYISMPQFLWNGLSYDGMRDVIGYMYSREGGTAMRGLFPRL